MSPLLWFYEVGNGLLMAHRRKRISSDQMGGFLRRVAALPIDTAQETAAEIFELPSLARSHNLTNYDAAYLAVAIRSGFPLATTDSLFRGSTETSVNSYVSAVRDCRGDRTRRARALFERIPKNRLFKIRAEDVRSTSGAYSPLMQTYLAFLQAKDARSWRSGSRLKDVLHEKLGDDPLGVHHIFPRSLAQERDFPPERLNTVANYAILWQPDNAEIKDRAPLDVWKDLKPDRKEWASTQLGFIGAENLLRRDAYEEFLEFRSRKMTEQLNEFLSLGRRE